MKTKAKNPAKRRKSKQSRPNSSTRKSIEDRDLNQDNQDQRTNVERDADWNVDENERTESAENSVEEEEEREKKRKVEDVHRDEWMK
jgi:hypothetical protein